MSGLRDRKGIKMVNIKNLRAKFIQETEEFLKQYINVKIGHPEPIDVDVLFGTKQEALVVELADLCEPDE